jgi:hypothetical protein
MSDLDLVFQGKTYAVPKKHVFNLVQKHPELLNAKSYEVGSAVPVPVFEAFVEALKGDTTPTVTQENAPFLSLLAKEFSLADLGSACGGFCGDALSVLSARVSKLEEQISRIEQKQGEPVESQEERLESLSWRFEKLEGKLLKTEVLIGGSESGPVKSLLSLREGIEKLIGQGSEPSPGIAKSATPPPTTEKSLSKAEFPMKAPKSLEGIISYLTTKHGGNVHEKGIVTITSKSVCYDDPDYAPQNVADLTSNSRFISEEPGQWICWDFREMRVRPTHYTIEAIWLKSWVVEGSLDGKSWTEIAWVRDNHIFNGRCQTYIFIVSWAVLNSVECRFIRLTQTDKNHNGEDFLYLCSVEFFGTLSE